jgi:hypothetical protein
MQPNSLPLSKRPVDIALIIFFIINLFFITDCPAPHVEIHQSFCGWGA